MFDIGIFCSTEGIKNLKVGSDFKARKLGERYGVIISKGPIAGLLARAIFIIKDSVIIHTQIVPQIADKLNYDAVFDAIKLS